MSLLCRIFNHKYYVYAKPIDKHGDGIRWLKCKRCDRNFVMNCRVKVLLPMDFELMDLHEWSGPIPEPTEEGDKS